MTGLLNPKSPEMFGPFFFLHESRCLPNRPWDFFHPVAVFSVIRISILGEVLSCQIENPLQKKSLEPSLGRVRVHAASVPEVLT